MNETRDRSSLGYIGEDPPYLIALGTHIRVITAIMLREMMTRFGREHLGFFWLMGEPLLLTLGVMVMWTLIGNHGHNVSIVAFVLSGYSLLTLWRHVTTGSIRCFRANAGLLFHRNIHIVDPVIARALLEIIGVAIAFSVAYTLLFLAGFLDPIDDPLVLVGGWVLMGWLSFSVGLIIATVTEIWEVTERFVQPIMYIQLPISGMFFMVDWLPPSIQELAVLNPQVDAFEMFRGGLLGDQVIVTHWYFFYTVGWCILLTAIGLFFVGKARASLRFE